MRSSSTTSQTAYTEPRNNARAAEHHTKNAEETLTKHDAADEVADASETADTVAPAVRNVFQEEPAAADAANAAGTSWRDGLDEIFEAILEASRRELLAAFKEIALQGLPPQED